jgi:hypothetical protein
MNTYLHKNEKALLTWHIVTTLLTICKTAKSGGRKEGETQLPLPWL